MAASGGFHKPHLSHGVGSPPKDSFDPEYYLAVKTGIIKWSVAKSVEFKIKQQVRSGIIPYSKNTGSLIFAMGVDATDGMLTDFGGWVKYKLDENAVTAAIREFKEETCESFPPIEDKINDSLVVYHRKEAIFFINIDFDQQEVVKTFTEKLPKEPEVVTIKWLNLDDLKHALDNDEVYSPCANLLSVLNSIVTLL